jgi:hypothetical protein
MGFVEFILIIIGLWLFLGAALRIYDRIVAHHENEIAAIEKEKMQ